MRPSEQVSGGRDLSKNHGRRAVEGQDPAAKVVFKYGLDGDLQRSAALALG